MRHNPPVRFGVRARVGGFQPLAVPRARLRVGVRFGLSCVDIQTAGSHGRGGELVEMLPDRACSPLTPGVWGPQLLHALPRALVPKLAALIGISCLLTVGFFCISRTIYEFGHLFRARQSLVTLGGVCLQTVPPFLCWVVFVLSLGRESSLYILAKHPSLFCKNSVLQIFSPSWWYVLPSFDSVFQREVLKEHF